MLTVKMHSDQVIRITVGDVVIRLRKDVDRKDRVAIEAPKDRAKVERFKVSTTATYATLEALEMHTGTKIGGPGGLA